MMVNILSEIVDRKREIVAQLRADPAVQDFRDRALAMRANATPHRLLRALVGTPRCGVQSAQRADPTFNIIAEFKRRSPSAGLIRSDLSATDIAARYQRGGACAISVLTDEEYFGGSISDLAAIRAVTALPLLRKDFIIDEIQIYEAAAVGADAVLLITAALDDVALAKLRATAEDELSLDAVVEVHTPEELRRAVRTGATLIGVNNRDLQTFRTSLETSERLIAEAPRDRVMISESGLQRSGVSAPSPGAWLPRFSHGRSANARARSGSGLARSHRGNRARHSEQQSTPMTNNAKTVGRLCQTPWRFTETPYNVEPALMKGRGGTPERRSRSDTPYQTPARL